MWHELVVDIIGVELIGSGPNWCDMNLLKK